MDRGKLKEKIAEAIRDLVIRWETEGRMPGSQGIHFAEAALAAIEASGYVLMPKDEILRKMSTEEFTEMMAGIRFKENGDG